MNRILILIIGLFTIGCTISSVNSSDIAASERSRIIRIAKQELARRDARLPGIYQVLVEEIDAGHELERPRRVYQISFSFAYKGKTQVIYTLIMDRRTKKVEVFSDSRKATPSKI